MVKEIWWNWIQSALCIFLKNFQPETFIFQYALSFTYTTILPVLSRGVCAALGKTWAGSLPEYLDPYLGICYSTLLRTACGRWRTKGNKAHANSSLPFLLVLPDTLFPEALSSTEKVPLSPSVTLPCLHVFIPWPLPFPTTLRMLDDFSIHMTHLQKLWLLVFLILTGEPYYEWL